MKHYTVSVGVKYTHTTPSRDGDPSKEWNENYQFDAFFDVWAENEEMVKDLVNGFDYDGYFNGEIDGWGFELGEIMGIYEDEGIFYSEDEIGEPSIELNNYQKINYDYENDYD